jgi:hypothetical protein
MGSLTGRLVTGSRDGQPRAWDLTARQASLVLAPSAGGWAAARRLPDGTWLGYGDPGEWFWSTDGGMITGTDDAADSRTELAEGPDGRTLNR